MIGAKTRFGAVIGAPVDHSASPALHNAAFGAAGIDAVFLAMHVEPADLPAAVGGLRALRPLGISVTVPHKQAVMPLCDRIAAPAESIGAVNCLVFEGDAIVGHNTDAGGFVDGLGFDPAGKRVVLLGSGGAARAVYAGLGEAGAVGEVVARTPSRATWARSRPWTDDALRDALSTCDLLVDCTSMGLRADTEVPVPVEVLPAGAVVATLVYHRQTALLAAAAARGLRTVDGAGMLAHQGARAFTLWTGQPAPVAAMLAALGRG